MRVPYLMHLRLVFRLMILSTPPLSLNFVFPSPPPKTLYFFRISPNLSQKNDDLGLIHRWIIVKFEHQVWNSFPNIRTIGNYEKMSMLREISFAS